MVEFLTEEYIMQKNSQELTSLLYEALLSNLENSIQAIEDKDYMSANKMLQKVNDILYRLGAGLNYNAGIISDQLDHLYNYMADSVIEANRKKDIPAIKEVIGIAEMLADAWNQSIKKKPDQLQRKSMARANAYEQNVMVLEKSDSTAERGSY
ncbi:MULTISPECIES: flagellar export chaperone FliS [Bacillaceae]|uniref:flagellar export chaperone FliS n=1 Tax=Bacillaceae TaxID=186817 RepID=UPI0021555AA1|nr:flagellar export chaperone FliS [Bacillus infantis]MCR6612768.1 flagellar export chaperone FliS [Bacillus infantis]MDW2876645.1 flagellar export chaperone FliS [Bacillus infantis]